MASPKVTRLPKQHKTLPHCAGCGAPLPDLSSVRVSSGAREFATCKLLAIIYHVRCPCGSEWHMQKTIEEG